MDNKFNCIVDIERIKKIVIQCDSFESAMYRLNETDGHYLNMFLSWETFRRDDRFRRFTMSAAYIELRVQTVKDKIEEERLREFLHYSNIKEIKRDCKKFNEQFCKWAGINEEDLWIK